MRKQQKLFLVLCISVLCLTTVTHLDLIVRNKECDTDHVVAADQTRRATFVYYNSTQMDSQFKVPGVVYDCLSRQTMRTYDIESVKKTSTPIRIMDQAEDPSARKSSFVDIFNRQIWGGKESGVVDKMSEDFKASGPGSDLKRTMGCMALLHTIIEKLKIHLNKEVISMADIPCGDLQWMSHFLSTRSDVRYTGIDIVPTLISRHTNTYKDNPNVNFLNADVVQSPLNQSFDFIFSRQMMQHFKNSDITRVLAHFSESGTKYMIATTYTGLSQNKELGSTASIRFRPMNLEKPPFNLAPPICSYKEPIYNADYLGFWELPLTTIPS